MHYALAGVVGFCTISDFIAISLLQQTFQTPVDVSICSVNVNTNHTLLSAPYFAADHTLSFVETEQDAKFSTASGDGNELVTMIAP